MKWNKFRLKTTTEAEDIVSSMLAITMRTTRIVNITFITSDYLSNYPIFQ